MKKRSLFAIILSASLLLGGCANTPKSNDSENQDGSAATSYPEKSVQFIIPYAAGGGTDTLCRLLASSMEKSWGESFLIANKPGGLSQVGLTELSGADPDGYTIGALSNLDHILVLFTGENVSYDYESFDYLGAINTTANVLMASKDSGFTDLQQMIDYAKEHPGELTVAVSGKTHVAEVSLFEQAAGIQLTTVMQDGGGDSLNAIMGGHVDCAVLDKNYVAQVEGQGINTLATFAGEAIPTIPDIPTMKSLGYDVSTETYRVIVAPAGTPKEIEDAITQKIQEVSSAEEFQESMANMGEIYRFLDQDQVKQRLDQDYEMIQQLLEENPDALNR
ncbi:tripartite tricarboxylate transporter substrate binding protein [Lawsonibacter sp. OA9]|jgi:uncharacterized protein UPF0065|uniref:Bug family tripartite tricarboxylate transporter substrate binding protein n=1 Tax=Eubacteriales TaxID=186802 RepID=UPI001D2B15DB|nr:tripartite tricarboxylate transporter substrate binding protein [Lawsonibacter sp. OA9]MBS5589335.1 tripartite tricarboxylate transporter substrate binding protein [Clostridiales bacterium]MCH1980782.1 tripartite tricarboxylate transporter substrate binding protein [Lawsonibacter sp. OA9]